MVLAFSGLLLKGEETPPEASRPVVPPATVPEASARPAGSVVPKPFEVPPGIPGIPPGQLPEQPPGAPPPPEPTNPTPHGQMPPLPPLVRVSDTRLKLGKIEMDTKDRSISFPAKLNMTKGNLEYLLVADYGKVHEALLSTEIQPFFLNVVMLLMKYEKVEDFFPDLPPESKQKPKAVLNDSNSFECKLSWTGPNGEAQTALLTEWLQNELTKKSVPRTRWGYTCSTVDEKGVFEPQVRGSIIAVYKDPYSMINSPLDGNDNDEIWVPALQLPAVGTKVQVTFFPYREAEAKVAPKKK